MCSVVACVARGFTLIEMAIVLVVLGLISSVLVAPLAARVEASQRHAAEDMLDDIVDALTGFALLHGRLPCPGVESNPASASYGLEQGPPCAFTASGYLPWRTLGLPARDPWGSLWLYRPDKHFAEGAIALATSPGSNIQIVDHDNQLLSTSDTRVVAVVLSTGSNRRADGRNAVFSLAAPRFEAGEPTPAFDDPLRWLGQPLLLARLARGGRL
jgi:prepilin-type N-terminal cleavage/methylation domain-containing protein